MLMRAKYLCIFLFCFVLICSKALSGQTATPEIDFHPNDGWQTKGAIQVRADGRMSLTEDGQGAVWKWVELDIDKYPILLLRISDSMPREWWQIVVAKEESSILDESKRICLIKKYIEEGGFIIPIKKITGWEGKVKFAIAICMDGHNKDWMKIRTLKAVNMTPDKPAAPKLFEPANKMTIRQSALHFCWEQAKNAINYELQVSANSDFIEIRSIKVNPFYLADKLPYLPQDDELLPEGKWFWRVRGFSIAGQAGNWSETGTFTVRKSSSNPLPPQLIVSNKHPLFIFFSSEAGLVANWKAVPKDFKPHTVFRIEEIRSEKLQTIIETAQENHIPILVQASGPHDYYGHTSSRIPLSEIERMFIEYPTVKGIYICEQAFRVSPQKNWIMMNYAKRLISLCADYGKTVFWGDGHWGKNIWLEVGFNKDLFETFQKYSQYIVPIWKMNGALTPYSAHDATFGFWISQAVDNWGLQPENWYWYEAGFGKLNQQFWFKEGLLEHFPVTYYGQMILLGLSSGAAVYSLEPPHHVWGENGGLSEISQDVTFPLLAEIVKNRLIPNRIQILNKMNSVYIADSSDIAWSLDYGTMYNLYQNTYGINHPFQMIPSTGKYFWLPILPKWTDQAILKQFPICLNAAKVSSQESVLNYLENYDTNGVSGSAWVTCLNNFTIVMNSSENWDKDQTFDVPMGGKFEKIRGKISVNSYLVAANNNDELRIHLNGREDKRLILNIETSEKPNQIIVSPLIALINSSWNAKESYQKLEFLLTEKAVTVDIK